MTTRVLVTRPQRQAGALAVELRQAGFEPVFFPVIEIRPMPVTDQIDAALHGLAGYDWVVFTSVNGVEAVWERFSALGIPSLPVGLRVAAIGPKTSQALQERGVTPDFVPEEYIAEAILPGLGQLNARRVLLPRAEIARKALPEAIRAAGGWADEIAVYQTLPVQPDPDGLAALRSGVQVITLTSPSTVENFIALAQAAALDPLHLPGSPLYACIGPITAAAARSALLPNLLEAEEYTVEGLVRALRIHLNEVLR